MNACISWCILDVGEFLKHVVMLRREVIYKHAKMQVVVIHCSLF